MRKEYMIGGSKVKIKRMSGSTVTIVTENNIKYTVGRKWFNENAKSVN